MSTESNFTPGGEPLPICDPELSGTGNDLFEKLWHSVEGDNILLVTIPGSDNEAPCATIFTLSPVAELQTHRVFSHRIHFMGNAVLGQPQQATPDESLLEEIIVGTFVPNHLPVSETLELTRLSVPNDLSHYPELS